MNYRCPCFSFFLSLISVVNTLKFSGVGTVGCVYTEGVECVCIERGRMGVYVRVECEWGEGG